MIKNKRGSVLPPNCVSAIEEKKLPRQYQRAVYVFMGLLVVYVIVRGAVGAATKLLWFDELLTLAVAGQPSLREMWHALVRGFDTQSPWLLFIRPIYS